MKDEADFVDTLVRLMRLTDEGKITWKEEPEVPQTSALAPLAPTLTTEVNGLRFRLEDARRRLNPLEKNYERLVSNLWLRYRLVILDEQREDEPVVSPPLQAATDLADSIRGGKGRLGDINRRLDEVLQP